MEITHKIRTSFKTVASRKVSKWRKKSLRVTIRSSRLDVSLGKGILKICSKFTGEHPCRSAILIKLQSNFIKIALRHGCSPVNLPHIYRTPLGGCSWKINFHKKQCFSYHIGWKTFIEASYPNNIHTRENTFCSDHF